MELAPSGVPVCSQAPLGQGCCCCRRCGIGGCDLRLLPCGCCFHTRCVPVSESQVLGACPLCHAPASTVKLLAMAFDEIDQAQAEAASMELSMKRGKKRQNATIARLQPRKNDDVEAPELRTGRWTPEETAYCDYLIKLFEEGKLPLPDGIKLNDFLAGMLKSKQARLTKKMKNAKLGTRQYKREIGYIADDNEARVFSQLETDFFASIKCNMERSEIKFHMQKEWRELFSNYCVVVGQKLDADEWLSSVEEMDRRASLQKDAARMTRRKIMMGYALSQDTMNSQNGVFIDPSALDERAQSASHPSSISETEVTITARNNNNKRVKTTHKLKPLSSYTSPFVGRVIQYVQRHALPFEHVDAWVPSFVPIDGMGAESPAANNGQCRLCFAGSATSSIEVPADNSPPVPIASEVEFDLVSFGLYSQKFSFDVGCGLPGRVYNSGISSWEQGITNAPTSLFERSGGAKQWGIQTVLGVPIASPNVGRIVVLFYSRFDRERDDMLVNRIIEELTRMMPSPQWKLVVDIGVPPQQPETDPRDAATAQELLTLVQTHMPADKYSPLVEYLPGFSSIRLLLTESSRSDRESELLRSALDSFRGYKTSGRNDRDATWMTARDFMIISKNHVPTLKPVESIRHQAPAALPNGINTSRNAMTGNGMMSNKTSGQQPRQMSGNHALSHPPAAQHPNANKHVVGTDPFSGFSSSTGFGNDYSFGLSPALQPIMPSNQADFLSSIAPLGLSASQLSALLSQESAMNFHGT